MAAGHETIAPSPTVAAEATTRALLACGALTGPFFLRAGRPPGAGAAGLRHQAPPAQPAQPRDLGWVQIGAFALTGLGGVAFALGVRRALRHQRGGAGAWGALPARAVGAEPGSAAASSPPIRPSASRREPRRACRTTSAGTPCSTASLFTSFTALVAACLVFARRFAERRQWGWTASA